MNLDGKGRDHRSRTWPPAFAVAAYDVGKMAQIRLTTTLAGLRDQENIRVNCLLPACSKLQFGYVQSAIISFSYLYHT